MTLLDLYIKVKSICGCLNSADVPLKFNDNDFNVDFEIKSKDAIVSHIEVKQDIPLTWEDIAKIDALIVDVNNEFAIDYSKEISRQKFYEEILKRFNDQRKK